MLQPFRGDVYSAFTTAEGLQEYAAATGDEAPRITTDQMVVRIANDLPELERLAGIVDAFFARNGLPAKLAFSVNLALDELVTNTVSYGYDDAERHMIEVRIKHDGDILSIDLEDGAKAYNPHCPYDLVI